MPHDLKSDIRTRMRIVGGVVVGRWVMWCVTFSDVEVVV